MAHWKSGRIISLLLQDMSNSLQSTGRLSRLTIRCLYMRIAKASSIVWEKQRVEHPNA